MGYYTGVSFDIIDGPEDAKEKAADFINDIIESADEATWGWIAWLDQGSLAHGWYEHMKLYDWEEPIKELSMKFPNVTFEMDCNGEESDDFWLAYIREGTIRVYPGRIEYYDKDWKEELNKSIAEGR
jgi:hypothetical protein